MKKVSQAYACGKCGPRAGDYFIRSELLAFTRTSRCFSQRSTVPFRTMTCTLRRAWRENTSINEVVSYPTLCRRVRLHHPRRGVSKARKRVGICPVCRSWDALVVKDAEMT